MKPWKRTEPTETTRIGWRTITSKTFKMPDGKVAVFDTVHPDGQELACVIALTTENKVVVARQYRPGPEKIMEDLPGGFVDSGESPMSAAIRELAEETGYQAKEIQYLGAYHKDALMNATWHAFIAYNCEKVKDPVPEEDEHVEVVLIRVDEFIENAKKGRTQEQVPVLMAYEKLMALSNKAKELKKHEK